MRLGRTFLCALLVSMVFVLVAWPGAGTRGVIAEEVQPYLLRYPRLIDQSPNGVVMLPPNDAPDGPPRFVGSEQWPELGYNGKHRVYPLFVRGHQTALGTWFGIVLQPVLGGGIAAVRRSSVLMALSLVILTFGLARRLGLSLAWSTAAALGLALSPGFWFFARTGYAFELASRVLMGACLFVAAPLAKIDRRRGILVAIFFGLAILARATIATTMAPALLVMLFHPKRDPGRKSIAGILALAGGIPIVTVAIALLTLPFGTSPAQNLRVAALAGRTLVAPATALVQLAWVVDARVILRPLIEGDLKVHVAPLLGILGGVSAIAALARWWNARATEGER
ncbi:MAG: glycosyltransferase family 39 protein, partial [Polyangiales bacterium]